MLRPGRERHDHRTQQTGGGGDNEGRHPDDGVCASLRRILEVTCEQRAGDSGDAVSGEYPAIVAADVPVPEEIGGRCREQCEITAEIEANQGSGENKAVYHSERDKYVVGN